MAKRKKINLNETSYYIDGRLRRVRPYFFEFRNFAKGRWIGRPLQEVFAAEFKKGEGEEADTAEAIRRGLIRINEDVVDPSTVIRMGDVVTNRVHRHEMCYMRGKEIFLIAFSTFDNTNVSDQTAFLDALLFFREAVHRIDRLTSGLVVYGKTPQKAKELMKRMEEGMIRKTYLARVHGVIKEDAFTVNNPIWVDPSGQQRCEVVQMGMEEGMMRQRQGVKSAETRFTVLSRGETTTLLQCVPITGRTHQIRVHLWSRGFGIVGDPLYNPHYEECQYTSKCRSTRTTTTSSSSSSPQPLSSSTTPTTNPSTITTVTAIAEGPTTHVDTDSHNGSPPDGMEEETHCRECGFRYPPDPQREDLFMCLHAHCYEALDSCDQTKTRSLWRFVADPPPQWVESEDFVK